jgi:hypothetical protein
MGKRRIKHDLQCDACTFELTSVPLEVIPGDAVSRWEHYASPPGLGTLLALLFAAAVD